jgi:hypothetical protein
MNFTLGRGKVVEIILLIGIVVWVAVWGKMILSWLVLVKLNNYLKERKWLVLIE